MDPITGLIIGGLGLAGSIFGSSSSSKAQDSANQSNAQQAKAQMDFQERMSSSAHQREVKDLEAAGLNPILSANSGASTPGGAAANFQSTQQALPGYINSATAAIPDIALKIAQTNNLNANSAKTAAETTEPEIKSQILKMLKRSIISSAEQVNDVFTNTTAQDIGIMIDPSNYGG